MNLKNKGFTLVELLAVIVVLAIIALIGYSTVGDIITGTQQSADKATIREYVKAIELARYNHLTTSGQDIAEDKFVSQSWLTKNVKLNNSNVVCGIVKYEDSVELLNCSVNGRTHKYCYNVDKEVYHCNSSESGVVEDKVVAIYGTVAGVGERTKNLFDYKSLYSDTSKFSIIDGVISGANWRYTQVIYTIPKEYIGKTLTFSAELKKDGGGTITQLYAAAYVNNEQKLGNGVSSNDEFSKSVLTFIPETESDYVRILYGSGSGTLYARNIQLEVSDTATDYEEYGYKIPITITKEDGISTTKTIYIDKQLEYGDYIDFKNSKLFIDGSLKDITIDNDLKDGNYKSIQFGTTNQPIVKMA